jgi:hypothetical protein
VLLLLALILSVLVPKALVVLVAVVALLPAHLPLLSPDHLFYEKYRMLFYEIILQTCYITY